MLSAHSINWSDINCYKDFDLRSLFAEEMELQATEIYQAPMERLIYKLH